ncbi:enhanced intracellular survival protein Eis [Paenibacillus allorhizosphaerae]|nr:GNAT family N-acetyltransferase [Paenibacillus allorhizosphaerae]
MSHLQQQEVNEAASVEIRPIPEEHFPDTLNLWSFAFQMTYTPEDIERRKLDMRDYELLGAYVEDRLAAAMNILDLKTWIQGKAFDMGGIASVATWPEYRRGGLVKRLLDNALHSMRDKGQTVSFLHPFQFGFYRRFGWETYAEYKTYEIPTALMPKLSPQPGRIVRSSPDAGLLNPLYEAYASRYNGSLVRSEKWWKDRIFGRRQGEIAVYYDEAGQPGGYVHYQVKDRVCTVHELVALHHGARLALWRFLADHDSMIDKLKLNAPADDRLPFLLDNPRIKQELVPYFMARIVDVSGFLEKYPFVSGVEDCVRLEINDAQAAWNNGTFLLKIDESGTAKVETGGPETGEHPVLSCDIQTLTAMMLSYQRPAFLHEIGRLQGQEDALDALERLIPCRQTYLPDFF